MATVDLQGIQKWYGDVQVVRDLDLAIGDGEFLVLVGASGCGKSTTLRMIAGLEAISAGTLRIGERVVNDLSPRDRDIAMVFQSYALYPHMTVYDNMAFGLRLRKMPEADVLRRVQTAAEMLGLVDLLQRKPAALSGGQRQRVAMGRAVVREPRVFLFDEPLSNLDAKLRVQMRLEIARLHRRLGTTTVYVTHDQVEAMTLAQRIAVMHEGWLQQCAAPQQVYARPANTYVATFIGSPAMNLWPVIASGAANGGVRLRGNGVDFTLEVALAQRLTRALDAIPDTDRGRTPRSGAGIELTLGVRPEDLQPAEGDQQADATLRVDVLEPLGAETIAYGALEGHEPATAHGRDRSTQARHDGPAIARLHPSAAARPGEHLALTFARDRIHLFDATGERLAGADA